MEQAQHSPSDPPGAEEVLRRLEERLERASEAAERLFAEAAGRVFAEASNPGPAEASNPGPAEASDPGSAEASDPGSAEATDQAKPPPSGWQLPREESSPPPSELDLLVSILESARELIPPDLRRRLAEALRELLLAVRALIDWYLERLDRGRSEPVEVQDIPIV